MPLRKTHVITRGAVCIVQQSQRVAPDSYIFFEDNSCHLEHHVIARGTCFYVVCTVAPQATARTQRCYIECYAHQHAACIHNCCEWHLFLATKRDNLCQSEYQQNFGELKANEWPVVACVVSGTRFLQKIRNNVCHSQKTPTVIIAHADACLKHVAEWHFLYGICIM